MLPIGSGPAAVGACCCERWRKRFGYEGAVEFGWQYLTYYDIPNMRYGIFGAGFIDTEYGPFAPE